MSVEMALDDLMTQRQAINLKVINISQSPDTAGPTLIPAKFKTLAEGGVLIVKTAGNNGRSTSNPFITPSGLTALVLTVGATNLDNQLTSYTSSGVAQFGADQDLKPDLVAPGGSLLSIDMKCADSNDADKPDGGVADLVADDYEFEEGTSFAAPVVAGSSALVIQALEAQGLTWDWNSSDGPRRVKSLLLATATETNQAREAPPSADPSVGRDLAQKDIAEGYGMINVDAATEAVSVDLVIPLTGTTTGGPFDRRAWARRVNLVAGTPLDLVLVVPARTDLDLYLYSAVPDAKGNPVLLAAAANAREAGFERFTFTPTASGPGLLVIKRISGGGAWSLVPPGVCGNGMQDDGEECDDGNVTAGDCCSPTCTLEPSGQQCATGTCSLGFCQRPPCGDRRISFPEQCDDGNTRSGDCCSPLCVTDADGTACVGGACVAGVCQPPIKSVAIPDATLSGPAAHSCSSSLGAPALLVLLGWALRRRRLLPSEP
jgi:cysteine-rich repeat protein